MTLQDVSLIETKRAESLALLLVTKNEDYAIRPSSFEGIDFVVELSSIKSKNCHRFGIQVNTRGKERERISHFSGEDLDFPVCQFSFDVRKKEGVYSWLMYPASAGLSYTPDSEMIPLNDAALERIIDKVYQWYETNKPTLVSA